MILKEEVTFIVPLHMIFDFDDIHGQFVSQVGNQLTLVYSKTHEKVRQFSDCHSQIIEDNSEIEDQIKRQEGWKT